jgi:hypothetical protein
MAASPTPNTYRRWFAARCPLHEACTAAAWSRQHRCESWISEDDVKDKVYAHLTKSSLHYGDDFDDLRKIAEEFTEVEVEEVDAKWVEPSKGNNKEPSPAAGLAKRRRLSPTPQSEDDRDDSPTLVQEVAEAAVKAAVTAAAEAAAAAVLRSTTPIPPPPPGKRPSPAALALLGKSKGKGNKSTAIFVTIEVDMLRELVLCADRSAQASHKVISLCESATKAFREENERIRIVRDKLQEVIRGIGL